MIARKTSYPISAGALALLVHGIFFSLLFFSFSWQIQKPQGMVVDIWDSLPPEFENQVPVPTMPEKQEQQTVPKVEAAPVASPEAEIELRDKKKKQKEEKLALEKSKAKRLAEKKAEQAERRMEVVERQAQERARAQHKVQEANALAAGKAVDEYTGKIAAKIRRFIVLPQGVSKDIRAEFSVTLLPGGEVLNVSLVRSSGNKAYDSAVERAILKAQPLPLPPTEQKLFNRFRDLRLKFSPAESGQ